MEFNEKKRSKRRAFAILPPPPPAVPPPRSRPLIPALPPPTPPPCRTETRTYKRGDEDLEEKVDALYTLLAKIRVMKSLWRRTGGENNKRVKPVLEAVWQPSFSLEDFGVKDEGGSERRPNEVKGKEREGRETEDKGKVIEKEKGKEKEWIEEEEEGGLDLSLSL